MLFVRYKFRHIEHNTAPRTHFSNLSRVRLWHLSMTTKWRSFKSLWHKLLRCTISCPKSAFHTSFTLGKCSFKVVQFLLILESTQLREHNYQILDMKPLLVWPSSIWTSRLCLWCKKKNYSSSSRSDENVAAVNHNKRRNFTMLVHTRALLHPSDKKKVSSVAYFSCASQRSICTLPPIVIQFLVSTYIIIKFNDVIIWCNVVRKNGQEIKCYAKYKYLGVEITKERTSDTATK